MQTDRFSLGSEHRDRSSLVSLGGNLPRTSKDSLGLPRASNARSFRASNAL